MRHTHVRGCVMWHVCMYVNNDIDMTWHDFSLFLFLSLIHLVFGGICFYVKTLLPVLARGRTCSCRENYKFDQTLT